MNPPVLVTGIGVVSCLGVGRDAFWQGLLAGRSAPEHVGDPHANMAMPFMHLAGELDGEAPLLAGVPLSRAARLGLMAATEAVTGAELGAVEPGRLAVVVGTGMGDAGLDEQRRVGAAAGPSRWSSSFGVAAAVADAVGATGAVNSLSNACAASGFGLAVAADLVRCGEADVVVAGGAEAYSRVALGCFNRLGALDAKGCRPFDRHRAGTVFGEGAAMVVLESAEHAERRGAPAPYARLAGSGWSCDAHHATAPEPEGTQIVRAMQAALGDAGTDPASVGCVVPHGTGTELNDVVESIALNQVLGARCEAVPLYSLKALLGHTGGAAGALAAVAGALVIRHRLVPANVPLTEQDPECKVWLPAEPVAVAGDTVLVNAYAFGGNNVSLVLEAA